MPVLRVCWWQFVLSCDAVGRLTSVLTCRAILITTFILCADLPRITAATVDVHRCRQLVAWLSQTVRTNHMQGIIISVAMLACLITFTSACLLPRKAAKVDVVTSITFLKHTHNLRLGLPQRGRGRCSSGMLGGLGWWLVAEISGLTIGSIFKVQAVLLDCFTLGDGTDR
jgi:hypothetical protein